MLNRKDPPTKAEKINILENRIDYVKYVQSAAHDRKERYSSRAHRVKFFKKKPAQQTKIVRRYKQAEELEIQAIDVLTSLESDLQKLRQEA
jgi:hypothetical protein